MISNALLYLLNAAEVCQRRATRLGCGHTGGDPLIRDQVHVCTKLIVQFILDLFLAKEGSNRAPNVRPEFSWFTSKRTSVH